MRVMLMHKTNPDNEAGIIPGKALIAEVGRMIGEMAEAGVFLDGTGLRQSALGVRLDFAGGQRTVTPGPLRGGNELTAGLCTLQVRSLDEAIGWATRFADIVGDAQIDIRPVTEPWDLGVVIRPPEQQTTRYMLVLKADPRFERGELPAPPVLAAISQLRNEMRAAGVYLGAELLQPSARARRVSFSGRKARVLDGPFTESKELIAGYVLLRVPSLEAASAWAPRYARCIGDVELDVRPLYEPSDLGG